MSTSQDPVSNSPETPDGSPTCKDFLQVHSDPPDWLPQEPVWGDILPDGTKVGYTPDTAFKSGPSSAVKESLTAPSLPDLLAWLHVKLAEAKYAVHARSQMLEGYERQKDPKYWEKLIKLPGVFTTRSRQKAPSAKERKEEEDRHRRILRKCEQEVAKIKSFITLLETLPERSASPLVGTDPVPQSGMPASDFQALLPPTMKTHALKTDPLVFDDVAKGLKTFELRKDDRGYQVGDNLLLEQTRYTGAEMQAGSPLEYTSKKLTVTITHILRGPLYGVAEGWVILSIKPLYSEKDQTQAHPLTLELALSRWSVVHRVWYEMANDCPHLGAFLAGWFSRCTGVPKPEKQGSFRDSFRAGWKEASEQIEIELDKQDYHLAKSID